MITTDNIVVEYIGKLNEQELEDYAWTESDKDRGVWIMFPQVGDEKVDAVIVLEYNDEDELEWGRIYTLEDLPQQLKNRLKLA